VSLHGTRPWHPSGSFHILKILAEESALVASIGGSLLVIDLGSLIVEEA